MQFLGSGRSPRSSEEVDVAIYLQSVHTKVSWGWLNGYALRYSQKFQTWRLSNRISVLSLTSTVKTTPIIVLLDSYPLFDRFSDSRNFSTFIHGSGKLTIS